ncbi:uncharacterized protein LOC116732503 isoform X3 [Xiphophorus hellerii]|nr:uncharacterized protein LOC116732503 isoform X3 [Xiphophorus hellerii]
MVDMTVEWSRPDAKHRPKGMEYVHLYRDNREVLDMKSSLYHGRTAFAGGLRHGNMSLIITNVTTADGGTYKCFVPKLHGNTKSSIVHLIIDQNSNLKPPKTITSETRLHPEAKRQSVLNVHMMSQTVWPGGTFPVLCCQKAFPNKTLGLTSACCPQRVLNKGKKNPAENKLTQRLKKRRRRCFSQQKCFVGIIVEFQLYEKSFNKFRCLPIWDLKIPGGCQTITPKIP